MSVPEEWTLSRIQRTRRDVLDVVRVVRFVNAQDYLERVRVVTKVRMDAVFGMDGSSHYADVS